MPYTSLFLAAQGQESFFVAQIMDLWETPDEDKVLHGRWFYQPREVDAGAVSVGFFFVEFSLTALRLKVVKPWNRGRLQSG